MSFLTGLAATAGMLRDLRSDSLPQLDLRDTILLQGGVGVVVYLIFHRDEPIAPVPVSALLIGIPVGVALVLKQSDFITTAFLQCLTTFYSVILVCTVIYRLSPLHPLARYPGPLLNKITKFWPALKSMSGKQHLHIQALHRRYGPVVRTGPNEIHMSDPACIGPVLGTTNFPKGPNWDGRILAQGLRPLIALRNAREHGRRRKPWHRAFSSSALQDYEDIIARRAELFVDALVKRSHVDLSTWFDYFMFDFMSDMAFGGGSEMINAGGDPEGYWDIIHNSMGQALFFGHVPWLAPYVRDLPGIGGNLKKFRSYGIGRASSRMKNGSLSRDLYHHLSDEDHLEKSRPNIVEVISDGALAVLAGADTTSNAMASLFHCLLANPPIYERLRKEVDARFPAGENALDTKHHTDMPYLNAVINEVLRLYPPIPSGSQRQQAKGSGGKAVGPYFVPEGTSVTIHTWTLHHDARNFLHPDTFWPERWLVAGGLEQYTGAGAFVHNEDAYIPFSAGPMNCVGKHLALMEMRMLTCLMVQRLRMQFEEGHDVEAFDGTVQDWFLIMKGPVPVVVTQR